ncbi:MAG: pyridoxamine 5-phosphate oxidase-related FMN-binding protein [Pseudonocardia sp.]|jgi:hypothetical protein|nr:pyridoxamine 5-phosphate oxidase-related FMN-binding protein [Pseudonocardia sp.]
MPARAVVTEIFWFGSCRGRTVGTMAKVYEGVDAAMAAWIEQQPVFFVATAPLADDGLVNLSPKGTMGTFRLVDEQTFAYLDMTGSGVETIAHLQENGRICVMFCAFDGRPNIVRLHGTGRAVRNGDPGFDEALAGFGAAGEQRRRYLRAVIVVDVARVSDSCGYAVPRMDLVEERETLDAVWQSRDDERIARYHAQKNAASLDGLPGLPAAAPTGGAQV